MRLSISNIAWPSEQDEEVYQIMKDNGFSGLEIAPTRIFSVNPYDRLNEADEWSRNIRSKYGFSVSSMQSIWYGRTERMFESESERQFLLEYTKRAINFAEATECGNLVFGCPKNRSIPYEMSEKEAEKIAIQFFRELGEYAYAHNTVLSMEANPPIYNTNFVNDTVTAIELVKKVDSRGFLLNLDVGTMIQNEETVDVLKNSVHLINHVHISEPGLALIEKRNLHVKLIQLLRSNKYEKYVSVEMGNCFVEDIGKVAIYIHDITNV